MTIKERILQSIDEEHRAVVEKFLDQQNEKGMATYGQTLDDCPAGKYDWRDMMVEELIDALQYANKRAIEAERALSNVLSEIVDKWPK